MSERPEKTAQAADQKPRLSPLEELLALDARLLSMLARRGRILQRAARGRQVLDREAEKRLRAGFDAAARDHGLDPRLARQLLPLLNGLGLEPAAARRQAGKAFALVPRSEPADIDIHGPRSLGLSRMLAVLAAATGQPVRLAGVVLNDPLVELVKALNQAGAHLAWGDDGLTASAPEKPGDSPLRFEDVLVFAGEEPFTLYALIALALREAGRSKFAGGAGLKLLNLRALDSVLLALGARLAPMDPRAHGLPARLESGGRMASRVELTAETPAPFAQALALAAWSYPEGLRLALADEPAAAAAQALALDEALEALALCRVPARREDREFVIPPAKPKLPAAPGLPLDPVLSAYLLALPSLAGGAARLSGQLRLPEAVQADFAALGLVLEQTATGVSAARAELAPGKTLAMGRLPEYLPLALALAMKAGGARVPLPAEAQSRARAIELLERLGAGFETWDTGLAVTSGELPPWSGVWTSPDPHTSLALALASFLRPGIAIDNPGSLAGLWPGFWALYNALPLVRNLPARAKEPEKHDPKPARKRVRV